MKSHDAGSELVVLMARWPRPGEVKTRLAAGIGADAAAALYQAFLGDIVAHSTGPWRLFIAGTPAGDEARFRDAYPDVDGFLAQPDGSLSNRMIDVFDRALDAGDRVVMRNTDSPTLPRERLEDAFAALDEGETDAVLGPDLGGGYYLVGLTRRRPELFETEMSTPTMLDETMRRGDATGKRPALLAPHLDVDTAEDVAKLVEAIRSDDAAAARCPLTCAELRRQGRLDGKT